MARKTLADRNFDKYSAMRARMIDILRSHIQFQSSHVSILADMTARIYGTREYARLPMKYQDMLGEVRSCWMDRIYELHLEWRLGPVSGPIRTAGEAWTEEMSALSRTPGALYGAHYWKGSDRAFGEYAPIN